MRELSVSINELIWSHHVLVLQVPGLAVVIVGTRKDSQSYVSMKRKACCEVGIKSFDVDLPEDVTEDELVKKVHELNGNPDVHGKLMFCVWYLLILF